MENQDGEKKRPSLFGGQKESLGPMLEWMLEILMKSKRSLGRTLLGKSSSIVTNITDAKTFFPCLMKKRPKQLRTMRQEDHLPRLSLSEMRKGTKNPQ